MKTKRKNPMSIEHLAQMTARGFADMEKRFDDMRDGMNKRFDAVEKRLEHIERRLDALEKRVETLEDSVEMIARRVERIEDIQLDNHAARLTRLEDKLFGARK